ncbi:unnamed protein product [Ceratitis capitata]|uniref:(Mediterranean fruit fly) hypothetical protein n=1 Tax=Ceratitis capitata TaxID=7213 RepID=A0A811U5R9_CERCA|nr:unnamed protein product [Ceratitis capitata]
MRINGRIFKKPTTQRKVKINPYTGNYHLCQSRSAAISRNMELMGLSGDKYTKRFAAIQHPRGASTTTPSALSEPSQQCHESPDTSQQSHESLDANNNNKENLITKQPTAAVAVETVISMKHEEKKGSEKSSRKRCKKSKGTSPKRRKRSLAYSESEYMNELEQFLKA